jgi:hypothetical protein
MQLATCNMQHATFGRTTLDIDDLGMIDHLHVGGLR